ncbi:MAG TPA: hypothetical protein PLS00_11640, partial [Niabella sp.]|nr:hypothetical protein [Niabella sp.]
MPSLFFSSCCQSAVEKPYSLPSFGLCTGWCDLAMCMALALAFLATFFVLLNWWASNISVTTIYATITLFWFQNGLALFTFVKILASV